MAKQTLHTIANALGISHVTVSLALSGSPRIAKETGQRVREYAASVGYRPNRAAQALKRRATRTFGYVLPGIAAPYNAALADYLYRAALEAGYMLQIVFSGNDLESERRAIEECMALPVDGLVVSSAYLPGQLPPGTVHPLTHVAASSFPLIIAGAGWKEERGSPVAMQFDHHRCFYELTHWLLEQGCGKIHLLLNTSDRDFDAEGRFSNCSVEDRIAGSRFALEEAGRAPEEAHPVLIVHPFDRALIRPGIGSLGDPRELAEADRALMVASLAPLLEERRPGDAPLGLITMNDQIAAVARKECLRRGLRPGCDVIIAGCDDTLAPWIGLTSYRWDYPSFSRITVQALLAQLEGREVEEPRPVGGRIIVRADVS